MDNLVKYISIVFLILLVCSCNSNVPEKPSAKEIKTITKNVADWQIETFEEMGEYRALPSNNRKPWHHRLRYNDLEWHCGALYAGMYEWSKIADNDKYIKWLKMIGIRNNWKLHQRMYHADDQTVGQFYVSLYQQFKDDNMLRPTQARFDSILTSEKGAKMQWYWCDALFMAPPVWARLAKVTGEEKYLEYLYEQYQLTYNKLWDKEEQLFYRDNSYFNKTEQNGKKIFWARGNGWVFGGLALLIPDLPEDWSKRDFFINIFQEIAHTLQKTQREDGTWSAGILGDIKDYPNIESSGSSFFTFGLAWGINNGLLDKEKYEPVLLKAWSAMANCVNDEGMLGYVQPVGAAPGESFENYTELYGSGAFLAAGSEMYKYVLKND